jgi:hypothetical protein
MELPMDVETCQALDCGINTKAKVWPKVMVMVVFWHLIIFPQCEKVNINTSKWIFSLKVEILQCFNFFGTRFEGPNPCLNWIFRNHWKVFEN